MTTVHVYCGNFIGPPYWHGLEVYEPDECNAEYDIEVDCFPDEFVFATYVCTGCGVTNNVNEHTQ